MTFPDPAIAAVVQVQVHLIFPRLRSGLKSGDNRKSRSRFRDAPEMLS
jgi:hypothetical protein